MGKGNNQQNQQRFQGAAQQQQGKNDEQAKQTPVGGAAADGTATPAANTGVPSGDSAEGISSTNGGTGTAVQSSEGADGRSEQKRAAGAPSVPPVPPVEGKAAESVLSEVTFAEIPRDAIAISPLAAGLLASFNEYAEVMNPRRPTSVSTGISYQRRLFRTIQSIINELEGKDFDVVFGNVLAQIDANATGAFDDLAVFRHLELREMNLVPADRRSFRDILNFLLKIAPLQSRAFVAKQVNLDATFAGHAFSEDGRQRVQNYCRID